MKRFIIAVATGITLTCAGVATVSAQAVIARTPGANGTASVSASPAAQSTTQPILSLDTPEDLKRATALPGLVWTRGSATWNDGFPQLFQILDSPPAETSLQRIGIPLQNGRFAVPAQLRRDVPAAAAPDQTTHDVVARAQTFVAAGRNLIWDAKRKAPLMTAEPVHKLYKEQPPYPITCSNFAAMLLYGYSYSSTTYVADQNTVVGAAIDFGKEQGTSRMVGANRLALWFQNNQRLWLPSSQDPNEVVKQLAVGDILFFSRQRPEGKDENTGAFFGNVYHTAVYVGNKQVIHSYGPKTPGGVVQEPITKIPMGELSFVARPDWKLPGVDGWSSHPNPAITGKVALGSTLQVHHRAFVPAPATISYQWRRDGQPIPGATKTDYQISQADVFHHLSVSVTASRAGAAPAVRTSAQILVPALEGQPEVKFNGPATVGSKAQAFSNSWYPYVKDMRQQWKIDGKPVPGATQRWYVPTAADRGKKLSVTVWIVRDGLPDVERSSDPEKAIVIT